MAQADIRDLGRYCDHLVIQTMTENRIVITELEVCSVDTMTEHPELFHYTKRRAFQSIVASNTFWASHYEDMANKTKVMLLKDQPPAALAPEYERIVEPLSRHN